jgi:hypothetical protein
MPGLAGKKIDGIGRAFCGLVVDGGDDEMSGEKSLAPSKSTGGLRWSMAAVATEIGKEIR